MQPTCVTTRHCRIRLSRSAGAMTRAGRGCAELGRTLHAGQGLLLTTSACKEVSRTTSPLREICYAALRGRPGSQLHCPAMEAGGPQTGQSKLTAQCASHHSRRISKQRLGWWSRRPGGKAHETVFGRACRATQPSGHHKSRALALPSLPCARAAISLLIYANMDGSPEDQETPNVPCAQLPQITKPANSHNKEWEKNADSISSKLDEMVCDPGP